jgi:tetratricopeptide (TPR) repeat protein
MSQESLLQDLATAAKKKQFAVLAQLASDYCALHPMEATGYYYLAVCNKQRSDFDAAKAEIKKALALDSAHTEALFLAAEIYMQLDETEQAGEAYNQLAANPALADSADIQIALSGFQVRYGKLENALAAAQRACEISPNSVAALLQRAQVYKFMSEYEKAMSDLTAAKAAEPTNTNVLTAHIALCVLTGQPEQTVPSFELLIEQEPRFMGYRTDFVHVLMSIGDYKKAESVLDFLLEYDPENEEYRLQRAGTRLAQEKYEDAISDAKNIIATNPTDARAYLVAAEAYIGLYDSEEAINILSQATDNEVENMAAIYRKRGEIYMEQYDFVRAADDFQLLALDEDNRGEGYLMLGKAYKEQGNLDEAFVVWQMAEEAAIFEASDLIEEFCQEQVAKEAQNEEERFIEENAPHAEENAKSPFIKAISAKYWHFDEKSTINKNPELFKELDKEMRDGILDAFSKMVLIISPKGLLLLNPEQTDFRAVYKITEAKGSKLNIEVQPLNGFNPRIFKFAIVGKTLSLDGFAEEMEFEIFFSPSDKLKPNEETVLAQRKAEGLANYI